MDRLLSSVPKSIYSVLDRTLNRVLSGMRSDLTTNEAALLFRSSNNSNAVAAIAMAANVCREVAPCGEHVTYVINRNINFTNACVMRCGFCAFSRTGIDEEAYFLPLEEILRRAKEAASLGATEICVQAGLPPNMNPELYPSVARAIKAELPNVHLHAFSPEEVRYGAKRRKSSISEMIQILKDAGVDTLPGTSAEILVDSVRDRIAKGRLSSAEWIEVITAAHAQRISTTATMMYGHMETPDDVATHLSIIRDIQTRSMDSHGVGFTEFVPLSFVAREAPMWKNKSDPDMRAGPTGSEVVLAHAVARLFFAGHIHNIQVSWVKEGYRMAQLLLGAGVNDLGGTLMNESISTAAGATHGQLATPADLRRIIRSAGKIPRERRTNYTSVRTFDRDSDVDDESSLINAIVDVRSNLDGPSALEGIENPDDVFGTFRDLTKQQTNRFKEFNKQQQRVQQPLPSMMSSCRPGTDTGDKSTVKRGLHTSRSCSTANASPIARRFSTISARIDTTDCTFQAEVSSQRRTVTYSSSFTIVPTYECFNACTYCNFRTNVRADDSLMLTLEKAEETLRNLDSSPSSFSSSAASSAGKVVDEILVLSGEVHPKAKRRGSWFQRIHDICDLSLRLGYLPHTNVGPLSESEMRALSQVNASMGLMVEQTTPTLMGGVHRFAPNKAPELRLQQLRQAGELKIAFTTGVLLGVGETKLERIQSIRDIAAIARKYGNIQEVILQPYSPGSKDKFAKEQEQHQQQRQLSSSSDMAKTMTSELSEDDDASAAFDVTELPGFIEEARHILPSEVAIQVPPNLLLHRHSSSTGHDGKNNNLLLQCINMGASDLGGISPFDEVNPDWAFPPIPALQGQLLSAGYELRQRLPIHERLIDSSYLSNRVRELVQSKRRC